MHNYRKNIKFDSGIISFYENNYLEYNCNEIEDSSIWAILSINYKLIGIHKGKKPSENNSFGLFFKSIIDEIKIHINEINFWKSKFPFLDINNKSNNNTNFNYEIIELIGKGRYGVVYKVKNKFINEFKAMKVINKKPIEDFFKDIYRNKNIDEINKIIKGIFSDYIETIKTMKNNARSNIDCYEVYENEENIYTIMELYKDNLYNLLNTKTCFNANEIFFLINLLNDSFKEMNNKKIIHGNIKLQNIFIKYNENKTDFQLKLCDYGSDIIISYFLKNKNDEIEKIVSLDEQFFPLTMDRCIFKLDKDEKEKYDLWSLGIMIYKLFFNKFPFEKNKKNNKVQLSIKKTDDLQLDYLISKLLQFFPKERLTWNEYFNYFEKNIIK